MGSISLALTVSISLAIGESAAVAQTLTDTPAADARTRLILPTESFVTGPRHARWARHFAQSRPTPVLVAQPPKISRARRHPVVTGALVGFGAGFLIGVVTTEGDISPSFMGLVWGGPGAVLGALIGKSVAGSGP